MKAETLNLILDHLEKPEEIAVLSQQVREICTEKSGAQDAIAMLEAAAIPNTADRFVRSPFYFFLLAYAQYWAGEDPDAVIFTERAKNQFKRNKGGKWNQAICEWLVGLLFLEQGKENDANDKKTEAISIINRLDREYDHERYQIVIGDIERSFSELEAEIQNYYQQEEDEIYPITRMIPSIKPVLQKLRSSFAPKETLTPEELPVTRRHTSPSEPEETPTPEELNVNSLAVPLVSLQPKTPLEGNPPVAPKQEKPSRPVENSSPTHIVIAVDMDVLRNSDISTIPLTQDLYQDLQRYNLRMDNDQFNPVKSAIPSISLIPKPPPAEVIDTTNAVAYVIPPISIFGEVTAGPGGAPYLDYLTSKKASAVDEILRISFEKIEYTVRFIDDVRISFVDGKQYGWFKVKGHSMNEATGNPINNNDYVLFHGHIDLENCNHKIVVAFLPRNDEDKLLTVKRLIILSDPAFKRKGFGSKVKYVLQSESTFDEDPDTGASYKEDIYIENDYQFVGEVIAIAKPPKSTS